MLLPQPVAQYMYYGGALNSWRPGGSSLWRTMSTRGAFLMPSLDSMLSDGGLCPVEDAASPKGLRRRSEEHPSAPLNPARRDPRASLKRAATSKQVIDDVTSRTKQANQKSSLAYDAETWSNTLSSLGSGGALVLKPWAILSTAALVLALLDAAVIPDAHVLAIPNEVVVVLGGTMSLLLAFRLNASYARWWEARNLWGNIIVGARQLITELITDARLAGKEALDLQVAGWTIAFAHALKHHLRGEPMQKPLPPAHTAAAAAGAACVPKAEVAITLVGQGPLRLLAAPDQRALLASKHAPLYALARLRQAVRGCTAGGGTGIDVNLFKVAEQLLGALTGCERILRTPCPPGYVGMLRSVMVVWLCFLPFTLVEAMGLFMVPVYSITAFLVLKVEQLAVEIENPFGLDFNDLPLEAFCLTVEADALRLMNELDQTPDQAPATAECAPDAPRAPASGSASAHREPNGQPSTSQGVRPTLEP